MQADKQEVLKRMNYIEGHLGGIPPLEKNGRILVWLVSRFGAK